MRSPEEIAREAWEHGISGWDELTQVIAAAQAEAIEEAAQYVARQRWWGKTAVKVAAKIRALTPAR